MVRCKGDCGIQIEYLDVRGNELHVQGAFVCRDAAEDASFQFWRLAFVSDTAVETVLEPIRDVEDTVSFAGEERRCTCRLFRCCLRLSENGVGRLQFRRADDGTSASWTQIGQGRFSPFPGIGRHRFARFSRWLLLLRGDELRAVPTRRVRVVRAYAVFLLGMLAHLSRKSIKSLAYYLAVAAFRLLHRRPIWLVTDRVETADDNGRAFFEYCASRPDVRAEVVFALDARSPDFKPLGQVGRVIDIGGFLYKLYYLSAELVISAYHTGVQRLPFGKTVQQWLKPLTAGTDFVYLKHGILKDDLSNVLGRRTMGARLVITAAQREFDSLCGGRSGYTPREIKTCGMPRYDRLYDAGRKNITFLPTWRQYLVKRVDLGENVLFDGFSESAYCRAYRELFSSQRLLDACERHGYGIRMLMHPNMRGSVPLLGLPPSAEVLGSDVRYRDVFASSGIVVTDYSSVFFDVAYLRKPIVYFQPDRDEFFANQYDKGYFDYDRDGFGEVEKSVDDLVDRLIEYMESGAKMKSEYVKRVTDFFAFTDKDNCRRVYEAIIRAQEEDAAENAPMRCVDAVRRARPD